MSCVFGGGAVLTLLHDPSSADLALLIPSCLLLLLLISGSHSTQSGSPKASQYSPNRIGQQRLNQLTTSAKSVHLSFKSSIQQFHSDVPTPPTAWSQKVLRIYIGFTTKEGREITKREIPRFGTSGREREQRKSECSSKKGHRQNYTGYRLS
ncbi:MAG: hypothetical protein J3Q66DRAFT_69154 [Benniella sp.]|nr:MAG: hypothetical protein J3Q66DRAFT_69154 [Benniella sp.]